MRRGKRSGEKEKRERERAGSKNDKGSSELLFQCGDFICSNHHLSNNTGGIWMKYCTVAKSMDRDRPICVEVNGYAHVACALRAEVDQFQGNHDAQIAAQATRL